MIDSTHSPEQLRTKFQIAYEQGNHPVSMIERGFLVLNATRNIKSSISVRNAELNKDIKNSYTAPVNSSSTSDLKLKYADETKDLTVALSRDAVDRAHLPKGVDDAQQTV